LRGGCQQHALRIEDQAIVEERTRIARELHDTLGHLLVAQHIQLENALLSLQSNSTADLAVFLQESQKLTSKALKNVRQAVTILRDESEEFIPFEAAIAEIVEEFHQMSPIRIQSNITLSAQLPQSLQLAARRILTEALTNIHKHSQATDASVTIEIKPFTTAKALDEPLVETALWVSVSDNGCGIHQPESASGFGLRGMRERVQSFGGRLTIESQPGAGCHLSAVLPIQGGTR
ncbi:MAG TPA: sensor histidine kinase, partial [Acidobacteriota bacterium]|nr:sensor histidine kinase [Acidobacteriota bacterium]